MRTCLARLALLSAAVSVVSAGEQTSDKETPEPCKVRAWVRAEDLSPAHISHGELRVKALRPECAHQIASVALRLQFDEIGEVKFVKNSAVIPELQLANQTDPVGYEDYMGSDFALNHQTHDDAMSNPALWTVKAEERRGWTTEATLLHHPDLSNPIVTPFTVAVPAVNYPPVVDQYRYLRGPVARYSSSDIGYRYISVVKFADGHSEDVLAGHTTFVPSSEARSEQAPFTVNTTFVDVNCDAEHPAEKKRVEELENCLPEAQRSTFFAEVVLDDGNVVQKGQKLKGRVTVRAATGGSTAMSGISMYLSTATHDHWAQAQAADGGDVGFHNATPDACRHSADTRILDPESNQFDGIFKETNGYTSSGRSYYNRDLTFDKPSTDFELEVPHDGVPDFVSYYSHSETTIRLLLTVLYSVDVAKCLKHPVPDSLEDELAATEEGSLKAEEGLWDMYTPIGKQRERSPSYRSITLEAEIPVVVLSNNSPATGTSVVHYLSPGARTPVLRGGADADAETPISFPIAQPTFTAEALANTSARLLQSKSSRPMNIMRILEWHAMNMTRPDPAQDYRGGSYAGLLWRKKLVAEERGLWPLPAEVDEGKSKLQEPFPVAH